ncbi:MAG TPA: ABC transporter substrate-binding protein [Baekduia sp.]|nr:ABC transporter substrate-binding protein [Baekduia sp.]
MIRRTPKALVAFTTSLLLAGSIAACGDKDDDEGGGGGGGAASGELKTGPGVTADKIRLGILTDSSGVFAGLGIPLTEANRAFWKEQNAKGGVCDRQVTLSIKDHGYDPQKAVAQYRQMKDDVLAFNQLLGSPITAALLPNLQSDKTVSVLASWASSLVANPNVVVVGATYDVEMINAVDRLVDEGDLKKGDKVGHIFFEGEYGENGLLGSKYAAEKQGLQIVEQKIKATDNDMSGQVAALKRAGVKAILVNTGPRQMASIAGVAAAGGLNVPIVGSGPAFDPALLKTPAAKALQANATIVAGTAAPATDAPGAKESVAAFKKHSPKGDVKYSVNAGYAESRMMYEILNKACENKDLTREGLQQALRELSGVDTQGLVAGTLDYSKLGEPPSRSVYFSKPDPGSEGGVKPLGEATVSENAEAYEVEGS